MRGMLAMVGRSSFEDTPGPGPHRKEGSHMYPNSALAAWQLVLMMVVAVALLVAWIIVVRLAGRDPGRCSCPADSELIEAGVAEGAPGVRVGEGAVAEEHVATWPNQDQRAA